MLKIYVQTREKGKISIDMGTTSLIGHLKYKIQKKEGTQVVNQIILYKGEYLEDKHTLKSYSIKNGSTVLLFNKKRSLLLKSSNMFHNSILIDRIRQSCIDLEINTTEAEIINLLEEAAFYLDKIFDAKTTKELFTLILSCFQHSPKQSLEIINNLFLRKTISNNLYLITASILSFLNQNHPEISIQNFQSFISKFQNEILPQIKTLKPHKPLILDEQEVDPLFQTELITDLALLSELTEENILIFYPTILHSNLTSKINYFIQKVTKANLLTKIPEAEFLKDDLFLNLNPENISNFISITTEQTFRKILPKIEEKIIKKVQFLALISNPIIEKCIEFDISMKSMNGLFDHFTNIDLILKNLDYLNKYKIQLPENFVSKITTFPKSPLLLKVISNVENLPEDILSSALIEANDLESYELAFKSENVVSPILSTLEFWKHILTIVSNSPEENIPKIILIRMAVCLEMNIPLQKFDEFYDHLIFDNFPPNKKQSIFLLLLFQCMKEEYRNELLEENRNEQRMERFFNQKTVPHYSLYKLFNFTRIFNKYSNLNPYQLYALTQYKSFLYLFHISRIEFKLKEESFEFLIEFIKKTNDMDLLSNCQNEAALSFIANSLIFASRKFEIENYIGITKETILPILAIAFNTNPDTSILHKLRVISDEYFELLIESFQLISSENTKQIYIDSINAILSHYDCFAYQLENRVEIIYKVFDNLWNLILNDKFKGNIIKPIALLFKLSTNLPGEAETVITKRICDKYGIPLFKFILQNKKEIIDNEGEVKGNTILYNNLSLDLSNFNRDQLTKYLIEEIQSIEKVDDIIQTFYFLNVFCVNVPKLQFYNLKNIQNNFQKLLDEEKWSDLMIFIQFAQYHKLKLEDFTSHIDLINHILNDKELENHRYLFDLLFRIFMKDSYIANKYAACILERCTSDITIKPTLFLEKASYIYDEFKEVFDRVFDRLYAFFPKDNCYDYRILIVRKIYKPLNYSMPGIDCSFIKKLIEEKSFQSFLCLYKIASYFPFLFEKQFYLIINAILPSLNYLHLLFDQVDEENLNNIKVFYSAYAFLVSCLYSSDFFSTFCFWLFENFTNLSNDQVYCMSSILFSLFQSDVICKPVLSLAYKYNFLDIMINLLNRKIEEGKFKENYLENLYTLSENYILYFNNVSKFATFIFFDMFKNGSIKNPFELEFNSFSATPIYKIHEIELPSISSEKVKKFINTVNEKQPFMLHYLYSKIPTNEQLSKFLNNFKNKEVEFVKGKENPIPYLLTIKMLRYLCLQPRWVFNYFNNYYAFARLPEHIEYLEEVANTVIRMNKRKTANDELCPRDFDPNKYFTSEICNESFIKFLMNEIETNDKVSDSILVLIELLVVNEKNLISFLHYISDSLESNLSFKKFNKLTDVIDCIIESNTGVSKPFFAICGNKFLHIALSPTFRFNESIMSDLVDTLCLLGKNLPIRTVQVIGFVCTLHPNLTYNAIVLYAKLNAEKEALAFNLIQNVFTSEKNKELPNFYVIKCFIEQDPSRMKKEIPFLLDLVPKYITRYITEHYLNDELFDVICIILNFLAPERKDDSKLNYLSIKNDSFLLYPPSDNLIQTSKVFWLNVYEKNRSFLNDMIKKNELNYDKLDFLHEFHELVSFYIRLSYFKREAKEMIDNENFIFLKVSRSNIIQDSFNIFSKYNPKQLLCKFRVFFVNEFGFDAGGLTREWFSYIIKELFNPDFGLFMKCGNESYFPNSLSYVNNNHIDYFKFTGQIIGLALMNNQYVNAHLSIPFIRQILHQDIVFKDLEDYDETLMKSLQMILDADNVKDLDLYFSIDDDQLGKIISTDLIKNGSKIAVTNSNKNKYVNLYADYKLRKSVIKQITAFCDGFDEIVPHKLIKSFSPSELNLMICGIPKININDMKFFTHYSYPYSKDHPVIQMFFKMLTKWSHENLAKLLLFITGSSQVPVNGFRDFQDSGNPICISPGGGKDRLPVAHTCSNMLCLPYYDDENDMNDKLLIAIQHCEFGFM